MTGEEWYGAPLGPWGQAPRLVRIVERTLPTFGGAKLEKSHKFEHKMQIGFFEAAKPDEADIVEKHE